MNVGYQTVPQVPNTIEYEKRHLVICVDLKMLNFLFGQQSVYTKHSSFLSLWYSEQILTLSEKMLVFEKCHDSIIEPLVASGENYIDMRLGLIKQ